MLLTVMAIIGLVVDIAVGAAAYKLARAVERNQHGHDLILVNHEERLKALEDRVRSCGH